MRHVIIIVFYYFCIWIETSLLRHINKEEALCLFSYTEIQLVAYAVLKGGSCLIHIGTYKNKHFNWFMINFSFLFQLE